MRRQVHEKCSGTLLVVLGAIDWLLAEHDPRVVQADFGASLIASVVIAIVLIALTELLRPKPNIEDARPAGLGDFQFPTATEGRVIPLLWGTVRLKGPNVVWYGDLIQSAITERIMTGLWSSTRIIKGFRYLVGVQMALCRGPNCVLKGVWIGDDQVYSGTVTGGNHFDINEPMLFGGEDLGNGGVLATCDFYAGDNPQTVNAYLAGNTDRQLVDTAATPTAPQYNGTCYVVARQLTSQAATATDIGAYFGNSTTIKPWSFEVERIPALIPGQTAGRNRVGTSDANPVNCLYEILTNQEWGFGFASSEIDTAAFLAAADTVWTENNGFSFVLTRQITGTDLLQEIERQIDGIIQVDVLTGLWTIVLARFDYDIDTVPQLNESNIIAIGEFTRGTWEETTNVITVQYSKRADEYKESFAVAQDMGNALIRGEGVDFKPVVAQMNFPGVKDSALAVNLAWRELRQKTYPLARIEFTLTREFFDLKVGQVVAWTDTQLGFTKLPLRVGKVDLGRLIENEVRVTCIQDVFTFAAASFGTPPPTGWTPPATTPEAFPADEQLIFEAPRAIVVRDPDYMGNPLAGKVFAAARRQSIEALYNIETRTAAGTPTGPFNIAQEVIGFSLIGELTNDLEDGTAIPTSTITLTGDPDNRIAIEALFEDTETLANIGQGLAHLVYIGSDSTGEFALVSSASISGTNVLLEDVYRGVLDSCQQAHTAGAKVWLLFAGAAITDDNYPQGNQVDVELRPSSPRELFSGSPVRVNLTMNKRVFRPYPPAAIIWDGTDYGDMDVEANGASLNNYDVDFTFRGRSFQTEDEVAEKTTPSSIDASTEYRVRMFWDDVELTEAYWSTPSPIDWTSSIPTVNIERRYLVNEASIDSEFRIEVQTRHDFEGETDIEALQTLVHRITPTSEFNGLTYLGGGDLELGNTYTATSSGTHVVDIGTAYGTAVVQYRINGGSWLDVITTGNTTGNITGVTAGETIELRISTSDVPIANEVTISFSSNVVAYGAFSGNQFDPLTISSLKIWIDPSDGATTTTSGSPLRFTAVTDKQTTSVSEDLAPITGADNPLVGTLGSRTAFDNDSAGALTFGNAAVFNRTNGAFTIAVAFELDSTLAAAVTTFSTLFRKIGSAGLGIDYQNQSPNLDRLRFFVFLNSTVYDVGTTGVTKDTPHTLVVQRGTTGDITAWLDGVSLGTTTTVFPAGGVNNTSDAILGGANDTPTTSRNEWCGRIGEFLFFDGQLSTVERENIEDYLMARWS
jgi:hypothetical protein